MSLNNIENMPIPFNEPAFLNSEIDGLRDVLENRKNSAGNGFYGKACEKIISQLLNCQSQVLLTTSATHALEMMALLLDLGPNDEVIVPSFTFVSTANAFVLRGAKVIFAECDVHGNLCLQSVRELIGPKTKAVCVVHYGGFSADMERLKEMCDAHNVILLEDAAQAIGGSFKDKALGTWGDLACFSFHETKNISCGEGGALVINSKKFLDRAEIIREKGTNRRQFLMGIVDKYSWVDVGSSYILSELNAVCLHTQLKNIEKIQHKRIALWTRYFESIPQMLTENEFVVGLPSGNKVTGHLFALVLENTQKRTRFIEHMRGARISTPFHYLALHRSSYADQHLSNYQRCSNYTNTDRLAQSLVRLPLFYNMTFEQQDAVISAVKFFNS